MKKLTQKQVSVGMVFKTTQENLPLANIDPFNYLIHSEKGILDSFYFDFPIGTLLTVVVPPRKINGGNIIDFTKSGSDTILQGYWSEFRNFTEYVSGDILTPAPSKVISKGPYNGFDVTVSSEEHIQSVGTLSIKVEFLGKFVGIKKLNTKMINSIKNSKGFEEKLLELLLDRLEGYRTEVESFDRLNFDPPFLKKAGYVDTYYSGGKVEFLFFFGVTFDELVENTKKQVKNFVLSENTTVFFEEALYDDDILHSED